MVTRYLDKQTRTDQKKRGFLFDIPLSMKKQENKTNDLATSLLIRCMLVLSIEKE
ncbi:hypothetical protein HMPREF1345_01317 [Enterococcus faecium TX1337RF]|nr:hypothetical protein HMPREF1345_01317 [Enterococcus faecium TX1337RF]